MGKTAGRPRGNKVTLPTLGGDHGTGTQAANASTIVIPIKDSPNRMGYRRRVDALTYLINNGSLTMRQQQAAEEIRAAFLETEKISSGQPLRERVQSSPKPDATVDMQVAAISRYSVAMSAVLRADRAIVEHVCCHGRPFRDLGEKHKRRASARFKINMDRVADRLMY